MTSSLRQIRRQIDCSANALIGAATTDIGHRGINLLVSRPWSLSQKRGGRHDLPGLTVAALGDIDLRPSALHWM
jgi:hypothetical protein